VLKQGGYVHLLLPAEFERDRKCVTPIGWQDPRSGDAELLWPQRVGPEQIADAKLRLGPDGYCGQFQQRPTAAGGGRFQSQWFRYYRSVPSANPRSMAYELFAGEGKTHRVEDEDCHRFAVMDPAGAEKEGGNRPCYTVIQVWVVTPTSDLVLRHQFREQVQTPQAAEAAMKLCSEFNVEYIAVEKDGLGLGIVQELRRKGLAVRAIKARGDKSARCQTAEIRMSNGQIYFPREAPFLFELEQELLLFPRGQYADQVDALAYAAMEVARAGGAGAIEESVESGE
jgi:predicted phage terminase large subunit-like protein